MAVAFYHLAEQQRLPYFLKDQFMRAASSIVFNLAEGSAKPTQNDRQKFYYIALGSIRECEAVIDLASLNSLAEPMDKLARHVCRLCKALG